MLEVPSVMLPVMLPVIVALHSAQGTLQHAREALVTADVLTRLASHL